MNYYISIFDNVLDSSMCINIIERFEKSDHKKRGVVGSGLDTKIKKTFDLHLSSYEEWKDVDTLLFKKINEYLKIYKTKFNIGDENYFPKKIKDTGYQIQKYNKNDGFYLWHTDDTYGYSRYQGTRVLAFIFYLNTIEEGGETNLKFEKVKPIEGRLLFFPALWTFPHKGEVPITDDKYIITGWIQCE